MNETYKTFFKTGGLKFVGRIDEQIELVELRVPSTTMT